MAIATTSAPAASAHVSAPTVQPFLAADFDAAAYLNNALPQTLLASGPSSRAAGRVAAPSANAASITELSSQLATMLAQLNAHTARLSQTLTQLTDDIIRCGGRLAYEVEVLNGDTQNLGDVLEDGLKSEIALLAPPAPAEQPVLSDAPAADADAVVVQPAAASKASASPRDPDFMNRLQTLTRVRARLDEVIQTFDAAMQWPMAPGEASSSILSVSGPGVSDQNSKLEAQAKQYLESIRTELSGLLAAGPEGVEAATQRVADFQALAEVWRGTSEEKPREKFVEGLRKLVEDSKKNAKHADVGNGAGRGKTAGSARSGYDYRYSDSDASRAPEGGTGYGFLQNLRI